MPWKLSGPCAQPGCPELAIKAGRCAAHQGQRPPTASWASAESDRWRGTPAERGYGAEWQRLRRRILKRAPFCQMCGDKATQVDHVLPKAQGGTDDEWNLQGLCATCHDAKTLRERGQGQRLPARPMTDQAQVTAIVGPAGSGKSYYVAQHSRWGDLIVDLDAIYCALSGLPPYEKPDTLLPFVCEARDAVIARLARGSAIRAAWIVTSAADAATRERLRQQLRAHVIVFETPPDECLRRIANDPRRQDKWELWTPIVQQWWHNYERDARDTVIAG